MGTVASANPFATSRKDPSAGEGLSWLHTIPYPTSGVGSSTGRNMCTYDTEALPGGVVADAHRAHPSIANGSLGTANPSYRDAEDLLLGPAAAR